MAQGSKKRSGSPTLLDQFAMAAAFEAATLGTSQPDLCPHPVGGGGTHAPYVTFERRVQNPTMGHFAVQPLLAETIVVVKEDVDRGQRARRAQCFLRKREPPGRRPLDTHSDRRSISLPQHRRFLVVQIIKVRVMREMPTMHRKELGVLRTQLRELNIEYSALVRTGGGEAKSARMEELKARRRVLMARIADATAHPSVQVFPVQAPLGAVGQAA